MSDAPHEIQPILAQCMHNNCDHHQGVIKLVVSLFLFGFSATYAKKKIIKFTFIIIEISSFFFWQCKFCDSSSQVVNLIFMET